MRRFPDSSGLAICFCVVLLVLSAAFASSKVSWTGVLLGSERTPLSGAIVRLSPQFGRPGYRAATSAGGRFLFHDIVPGKYELSVEVNGKAYRAAHVILITPTG